MAEMHIKEQLIAFMSLVNEEVSSFVNDLSEAEKSETGSREKWAAKDVFSHLVFWGNHFNNQLTDARRGEKAPTAGDYTDEINDGVLYRHLEQPFSEALSAYAESFQQSKHIVADTTPDDLSSKGLYDYLNGRSILDMALGTFGWHVVFHISDHYLRKGQLEKAIALQEKYTEELRSFPDWEANAIYNLACFYAQIGEVKKVIANLKPAFLKRPDLIEWAKNDPDLDPLREDPAFIALFAKS